MAYKLFVQLVGSKDISELPAWTQRFCAYSVTKFIMFLIRNCTLLMPYQEPHVARHQKIQIELEGSSTMFMQTIMNFLHTRDGWLVEIRVAISKDDIFDCINNMSKWLISKNKSLHQSKHIEPIDGGITWEKGLLMYELHSIIHSIRLDQKNNQYDPFWPPRNYQMPITSTLISLVARII